MDETDRYEDFLVQEALGPDYPQAGRRRMIMPSPIGWVGTKIESPEMALAVRRCR